MATRHHKRSGENATGENATDENATDKSLVNKSAVDLGFSYREARAEAVESRRGRQADLKVEPRQAELIIGSQKSAPRLDDEPVGGGADQGRADQGARHGRAA